MNKENRVIWQKLEKLGWCKEPAGIELDFFEDVIKCTKEAINYTRCSEQLKDKETPTFEDWKKNNLTDTNCYGGSYKHKLGWKTKEQLLEMYQREWFF